MKTFKEYRAGLGGHRIGYVDNIKPMASLGDVPPKGQAGRDSKFMGLAANYTTQGVGTIKPMITADAKNIQMKNWKSKGMGPYKFKKEEVIHEFSDSMLDKLEREYKGLKGKTISIQQANKLRQIFKMIPDRALDALRRRKIPFLSGLALTRMIQKGMPVKEDTKRVARKPGQKAGSDKHSDLYTDENPRGTIHGLGFTDAATARKSVNKIKSSGKTHAHKIQAAIAMSQRAKVASERAKDPEKKKDLGAAHKTYQNYIDTNKKSKD